MLPIQAAAAPCICPPSPLFFLGGMERERRQGWRGDGDREDEMRTRPTGVGGSEREQCLTHHCSSSHPSRCRRRPPPQSSRFNNDQTTSLMPKERISRQGIPVLVRVVAPPLTPERVAIDLVAVLDVRCGGVLVPVNRMDLLNKAMELVMDKLSSQDRLAIVPVQSSPIAMGEDLLEMNVNGRAEAAKRVKSLAVGGGDNLSTALNKAVTNRAGFVILISDCNDSSILNETMNLSYSVHAFGFRDAHNPRAMHHIANSSTGTYGILNDEHDGITDDFTGCLNNIASIVAVDTQVNISCDLGSTATLSAIESGRFKREIKDDRTSGFITAGALQAGAVRSFIVYVDGDVDENNELPITVHVRCEGRSTSQHAQNIVQQNAQVVVVRHGDENSRLVAAEIVRVEAMRIVDEIIKKYNDNGKALSGAADELHDQWRRLKESEYGEEAGQACLISVLTAEMEDMEATIRRSCGMSYMLSWQTRHSLQHQTRTEPTITSSAAAERSPAVAGAAPDATARGAKLCDLVASGAHNAAHTAAMAAAAANCGLGGAVNRKRNHQHYYGRELEMIERRLAFWKKVQYELPPMPHDGERPDHVATIFQKATQESLDHAMFHDVFLAIVHSTCRRGSKCGGDCSCGH
ncbi:hypothetical protein E2562_036777 [Oryza meyeriana var. granulata]|uniref:VWFA domain-containing protein n=1 Tax=Oryza meyeriana var. granulata TaxID=110450 RepID=A0A6G1CA67_9ORYZ|nr:hypothetical protein E2562_036777 [Oryza meyeriana var. granulata]